ncbi:biotin--[acetyl-CoA-carboxylase] ligase [Dysgonomonas sp. 25]|uniref:biotin--[acetyl-CoA-carboxylase] ligase n=1 Tax=Dysgonomonas sp. 25 TaxID=2302933 RepID=UPI0013D2CE81|nr:biotin--[acetyl-CoA-carboxylase] ligase [Dysgonomonas sp. 25]NDV68466.1 biotin--[acetyl-CoA-carboxylase] ligase [Dysgonomonas sp. 25]
MPQIIHLTETDSTNTYLKELALKTPVDEMTIVRTDYQSAGKGQRGNVWESERGKNLLFSVLLQPGFIHADKQFILSQLVSLAIKDVLSEHTDGITIKWPNDIYWQEKKICGILVENNLIGNKIEQSVIGIGININQETFVSDAPNPVSLQQITGKEYNIEHILYGITDKIVLYYNNLKDGKTADIISAYKSALFRREGYYWYDDGTQPFEARIADIEDTGILHLETKDKQIRKFAFKEVTYISNS